MLPQVHQKVITYWQITKWFLKEKEIVRYSNGWNPLSSKPQIKNIKEYQAKKKEESKERIQVASTRKPQAKKIPQEGKKKNKKNFKKPYSPVTGFQISKKVPWKMSSTWPEPGLNSKKKRSKE
ncbi:hypothetical protein O181_067302 [Austropuccinia psidii MF-1]|uniref:Uncharacterized protein n=1 Tax=Austropuccinia psidii MF-1 TaxID=1389203 RepID=A0A9Q3EX36_9BASI|nr:hypothetical protein [Austropuccinia psidii MF-1]